MSLLKALCRTNQGILKQKLMLMSALSDKHGAEMVQDIYRKTCPIVGATLGQHIRHSMDHMERAVSLESEIHYDLRLRATSDETDWTAASERIQRVDQLLTDLSQKDTSLQNQPVDVYFMLSGDKRTEYCLPSTVARELGFAAHHAIHHMAMVKIIATCSHVGRLQSSDLPPDFGRAPSTVNYDLIDDDVNKQ